MFNYLGSNFGVVAELEILTDTTRFTEKMNDICRAWIQKFHTAPKYAWMSRKTHKALIAEQIVKNTREKDPNVDVDFVKVNKLVGKMLKDPESLKWKIPRDLIPRLGPDSKESGPLPIDGPLENRPIVMVRITPAAKDGVLLSMDDKNPAFEMTRDKKVN